MKGIAPADSNQGIGPAPESQRGQAAGGGAGRVNAAPHQPPLIALASYEQADQFAVAVGERAEIFIGDELAMILDNPIVDDPTPIGGVRMIVHIV